MERLISKLVEAARRKGDSDEMYYRLRFADILRSEGFGLLPSLPEQDTVPDVEAPETD